MSKALYKSIHINHVPDHNPVVPDDGIVNRTAIEPLNLNVFPHLRDARIIGRHIHAGILDTVFVQHRPEYFTTATSRPEKNYEIS